MPLLTLLSIEDAPDTQRGQDVGREARISQAMCLSSYHVSCVRLPWARLVLKAQSDWGALFAAQNLLMIEVMEIPIVFFSLFFAFCGQKRSSQDQFLSNEAQMTPARDPCAIMFHPHLYWTGVGKSSTCLFTWRWVKKSYIVQRIIADYCHI